MTKAEYVQSLSDAALGLIWVGYDASKTIGFFDYLFYEMHCESYMQRQLIISMKKYIKEFDIED